MHCENCFKKNITSHHKCSGCEKWIGRCCLVSPAGEPNWCRSCTNDNLTKHYDNAGLGY